MSRRLAAREGREREKSLSSCGSVDIAYRSRGAVVFVAPLSVCAASVSLDRGCLVPQGSLSRMLEMFPCSNTPDSNEWEGHRALWKPDDDHSFESGVLEQGNIENMKDSGC